MKAGTRFANWMPEDFIELYQLQAARIRELEQEVADELRRRLRVESIPTTVNPDFLSTDELRRVIDFHYQQKNAARTERPHS